MENNPRTDTILVVSKREFPVNRKALVEGSSYFRAMFDGNFIEAKSDKIYLKDIGNPDAFAVLIDYTLKQKINLKETARVLEAALALADMWNYETFPELLKQELFKNWADLETFTIVLHMAETLGVRESLLIKICEILKVLFTEKGCNIDAANHQPSTYREDTASEIAFSTGIIIDLLGTDEARSYCFTDFDLNEYFVKGMISWTVDQELNESSISKVVQCLGIHHTNAKSLMDFITQQKESKQKHLLQKLLKKEIESCKAMVKHSVSRLLVGWIIDSMEMYSFDFENWMWDLISFEEFSNLSTSFPDHPELASGEQSSENKPEVNVIYWYSKQNLLKSSCYADIGPGSSTTSFDDLKIENVYSAGLLISSGEEHTLKIYKVHFGENVISIIFEVDVLHQVLGCQLLRLDDVIHGFVAFVMDDGYFTVSHFSLQKDCEVGTWNKSDFQFETILTDLPSELIPVALTKSKSGILVLFQHEEDNLWLADYRFRFGRFKPLGYLPMPCKQGKKAMTQLGLIPRRNVVDKAKKICSFKVVCCGDTSRPLFHMSSKTENTANHVACPFFYDFNMCCGSNGDLPELVNVINLCYYSETCA